MERMKLIMGTYTGARYGENETDNGDIHRSKVWRE